MSVALLWLAVLAAAPPAAAEGPRVFLLDPQALELTRSRVRAGDPQLAPALARLRSEAQRALATGVLSVTTKPATPPSGDKHDYMSQAPYFWPNPDTPNKLPYVRRDGERNPEILTIADHDALAELVSATETLALAYHLFGDDAYAAKAADLLRGWFLDPVLCMNPHLQYGQAIPGLSEGRGIGIIDTAGLPRLVDAAGLLAGSRAWSVEDQQGLALWFEHYLNWLRESGHGREEGAATNNHGTYYDAQVASLALFLGRQELAAQVLTESCRKRIAAQIEPDGRQPRELERTRAWSYSVMNLRGLFWLAALGERCGVDVWGYQTTDGRSLRKALEWLAPFAAGKPWPHPQIGTWSPKDLAPLLRQAAVHYRERRFEELIAGSAALAPDDRVQLTHPAR